MLEQLTSGQLWQLYLRLARALRTETTDGVKADCREICQDVLSVIRMRKQEKQSVR